MKYDGTEISPEYANKILAERIKVAKKAIESCIHWADHAGLEFDLSFGEPVNVNRDIGGTYYGKNSKHHPEDVQSFTPEYYDSVQVNELDDVNDYDDEEETIEEVTLTHGAWVAWQSSSEEC